LNDVGPLAFDVALADCVALARRNAVAFPLDVTIALDIARTIAFSTVVTVVVAGRFARVVVPRLVAITFVAVGVVVAVVLRSQPIGRRRQHSRADGPHAQRRQEQQHSQRPPADRLLLGR
jgi:hypothetical protein